MPRNTTTARQPAPKKYSPGPNVLRFIASLLFLYVVFAGSGHSWWSGWVTSGVGAVWLPILFGVAVLGSIGLFFMSLGGLAWKMHGAMASKVLMLSSFALVALTASPLFNTGFWIVILGFLIGWFGTAMEWMM
jgi:hypothetical protein